MLGNQYLQSALRTDGAQPKLNVGRFDEPFEQEADRIAAQVLHPSAPRNDSGDGRVSAGSGGAAIPLVRRRTFDGGDTGAGAAPAIVHEVLASPGQPLDASTRAFFEPRFAHDFANVRVHSDAHARQSVRAVNASAYAVGSDIVLGDTAQRSSVERRHALAHELVHVIQQTAGAAFDSHRPLTDGSARLSRMPASTAPDPAPAPTPGTYSLPVGHGAFNISLGEQVVVYDAGTRGKVDLADAKLVDSALEEAKALIPGGHIDVLRITHAHSDHVNFVGKLLSHGFTIGAVEINLFQLEFGGSDLESMLKKLSDDTTLRVLYYDYDTDSLAIKEITVGAVRTKDRRTKVPKLSTYKVRQIFGDPSAIKLTQESLKRLQDADIPRDVLEKLRDLADREFTPENLELELEQKGIDKKLHNQILIACIPDVTGQYEGSGYAAFVASEFARRHFDWRRNKKTSPPLDALSTIYFDESVTGVRVVHGSDPRVPDWIAFGTNPGFDKRLRANPAAVNLWVESHHLGKGFLPNDPDQVLVFLDQMIERQQVSTTSGKPGRHIVSAAIDPLEPVPSIPYLMAASGFEILLAHDGTRVEASSAGISGNRWFGPLPQGAPLRDSYVTLRLLQRLSAHPDANRYIEEIRNARREYVRQVIALLQFEIEIDVLKEMRRDPALRDAPVDFLAAVIRHVLETRNTEGQVRQQSAARGIREFVAQMSGVRSKDAAAVIARRAAQMLTEQAGRLDRLVGEAQKFLRFVSPPERQHVPTAGGETGIVAAPEMQAALPAVITATPTEAPVLPVVPTLSSTAAWVPPAREYRTPVPTTESYAVAAPWSISRVGPRRPAGAWPQLPDYQAIPDFDFESREPLRIRVGQSWTTARQSPSSEPAAGPKSHPSWEWPPRPSPTRGMQSTASRPAARGLLTGPVSGATPLLTETPIEAPAVTRPLSPAAVGSRVPSKPTTVFEPLPETAPSPVRGLLPGPTATDKPRGISPEGGSAMGMGAALVAQEMASKWTDYVTERAMDQASRQVSDFWPDLDRARKRNPQMSAVYYIAMSYPTQGGAKKFRFVGWTLVPASTVDEAKKFHVDRGGYAPPQPAETISIEYHWIPPLAAREQREQVWVDLDSYSGWLHEKTQEWSQALSQWWFGSP